MAPRGRHSAASMMQANTNSRPALAPGNDKIADFLLVKQNLNILLVCLVPSAFAFPFVEFVYSPLSF